MKKLAIYLTVLASLALFSCKKEVVEPTLPCEEVVKDSVIDVMGKDFVLIDGNLYLENMDNGEKTVYSHFDGSKTVSGMRMGNYEYEVEKLEVDVTTWSFRADGSMKIFILNDNSDDPYELTGEGGNLQIIEHRNATLNGPITIKMGGSSKPFQGYTEDFDNGIIKVYVNEAYTTIDGVQYTYFNELFFQEVI